MPSVTWLPRSPSRRAHALLAVLSALAACLLGLAAVPNAHAARGMEIAVQDDGQFLNEDPARRLAAFEHARALGAASLRTNMVWASVVSDPQGLTPPVAPVYDFARFDRLVEEAAAYGIRVQITLAGAAPAWATADHKVSNNAPNPAYYGQLAGAVAAHFNGRVRAISIWNEPNWHGLLTPERICRKSGGKKRCAKTSARRYRALYQAGYTAIKRAAPAMPVWIGETNPYVNRRKQSTAPLAWIRQLVCADKVVRGCKGTLRAEGYAHHPYAFDRSPTHARDGKDNVTIANLGKLSKQLRKLRRKLRVSHGSSIYLTEFAYYSSGPNAKSEGKRAAWTRKAFEVALKAPKIRQLLYYQLVDPSMEMSWRTGLIAESGVAHAAYRALVGFAAARGRKLKLPAAALAMPSGVSGLPTLGLPLRMPRVGVPLL